MSTAQRLKTNAELLRELATLPDEQTGEVIDGSVYVMGRPGMRHQKVENKVAGLLDGGGPGAGGWLFVSEVSVRFASDEEVVPDVSGWRRERLEGHLDDNPIRVRPDWVCEILSDSTRAKDLGAKRLLYARQGVPYLWLIDPVARVLEAFELVGAAWQLQGTWSADAVVKGLAPWPELTIQLADWWLD